MASIDLTAGMVMDDSAALLNDAAKEQFGAYTTQLPYLNIALKELRKHFERANIPATDQTSAVILIAINQRTLEFNTAGPASKLPDDLVDIRVAWQRPTGSGQTFIPLPRLNGLPVPLEGVEINYLYGYVWEDQMMKWLPANCPTDIKLEYVRQLFPTVTTANSPILCINGDSFLAARTAALVAKYVEENEPRSQELNATAGAMLEDVIGIGTKGNQSFVTRRRPFRGGYKTRIGG